MAGRGILEAVVRGLPEAKVIISVRPSEGWHTSVMETIYPSSRAVMLARPQEFGDVPDAPSPRSYTRTTFDEESGMVPGGST